MPAGPRKSTGKKRKSPALKPTRDRQKEFLLHYAETCNLKWAARRSGIGRQSHYDWLTASPEYAEAFRKVHRLALDSLESDAVERATVGWVEPVYYQGAKCGEIRRYDGTLMQFLLRGMMPEKYGNRTEVSGPEGQPIQAKIEVVFVRPEPRAGE